MGNYELRMTNERSEEEWGSEEEALSLSISDIISDRVEEIIAYSYKIN